MKNQDLEVITLGGGCFWCLEAIIKQLKGVEKVISGYSGGNVPGKPTYKEVCSGKTGHAEVVQVTYNPSLLKLEDLLAIFMTSHDPTTLNQQGGDIGTQYRSVIFFHTEKQKEIAKYVIKELNDYFENPIVTYLRKFTEFFEAEQEHHNFYENNPNQTYCSAVITPKLAKLREMYKDYLK